MGKCYFEISKYQNIILHNASFTVSTEFKINNKHISNDYVILSSLSYIILR
jgi:hypothetical protein